MKTLMLHIHGLVQGIGFRPFIYKIALNSCIKGYVQNLSDCVVIAAQGKDEDISIFIERIRSEAPVLARIEEITVQEVESEELGEFSIRESEDYTESVTDISPDIAVCELCLKDLKEQPHRVDYPFVNCTFCGPRFSIIKGVPYDRPKTTMAPFRMCPKCAEEYADPSDRRFHAQPLACNSCGPSYTLCMMDGKEITGINEILEATAKMLEKGSVVAVKGIGGFHLACNPFMEEPLRKLRSGKRRDGKPFALMFCDLEALKEYAFVDEEEEKLLLSAVSPIVLLKLCRKMLPGVNSGLNTIGAMLPYMPFHYMLFERLDITALVMTSGNISEEPVVISNSEALETFRGIADAVLCYNRDIYNRVDDSVTAVYAGQVVTLRRSRGLVPSPVNLSQDVDGIVAVGAELKNCFAVGKGNKAILSQHIGDLKNAETLSFFEESLERFRSIYRVDPVLFACDKHPDYLSSIFAHKSGLPVTEVQHHHAHIASCLAEHNIDREVIGVSFDGVGLGDDGAVWGGEFLVCDLVQYRRFTHLRYVNLPGGDRASVEPWRMAAAYLYDIAGEVFSREYGQFFKGVDPQMLEAVGFAMKRKIGCLLTSSAGRLFDAVSALAGICSFNSFEAEAAMRLEGYCDEEKRMNPYDWELRESIDIRPAVRKICEDVFSGVPVPEISGRFHSTIIDIIEKTCLEIRRKTGLDSVVLSGGCFQNRFIFRWAKEQLKKAGFTVYTHSLIPCNDGGIALGQLAVAAGRRSRQCV